MRARTRQRWIALQAASAIAAVAWVLPAATGGLSVADAASCSSTENGDWDGFWGYSRLPANLNETPEGVSSYIRVEGANVCTSPPVGHSARSSAWVMLHDKQDSSGQIHYMQAGYMFDQSCMQRFTEYNITSNPNSWVRAFEGICASTPDNVTARVLYLGPPGAYPPCCYQTEMYADNFVTVINFDGWNAGWSFQPEYLGEVNFWQSDVPGTVSNVADMPGMGIQSADTGQLRVVPCYLAAYIPANSRFHSGYTGCDHIWIWTNPVTP